MAHYDDTTSSARSSSRARSPHPVPPPVRRAMKQTAEAVETWRKLRGLTQTQLADRAGVGRRTIIRLESGDGGVTIENLLRVLRALGLLDTLPQALDPYESDIGRLRADEQLPRRVRPRSLTGGRDG
jgi:DNA-binding XRE family transcriptional regulator